MVTKAQLETADLILSEKPDKVEFWMDKGDLGVQITNDGLIQTAFFGENGVLKGDWL